MVKFAYSERITDRYVRRNFINGIFTLFSKDYFVYTFLIIISTTLSLIANKILIVTNFNLLEKINIFEISVIFAFIITGILASVVKQTKYRILLIIGFSIGLFPIFNTILYNFWGDILNVLILTSMGLICLNLLIVLRNFNTSWIGRFIGMGKSKTIPALYSLIRFIGLGIGISIYLVYLFYTPDLFEPRNYNFLFLAIFNLVANLLLMLIVFKKSFYEKYPGHDYFVQITSFFYTIFAILLLFVNLVNNEVILPILNFGLIIFTILSLTQAITLSRSEFEEKLTGEGLIKRVKDLETKKGTSAYEDTKDIIIITIEDEEESELEKPKLKKPRKKRKEIGNLRKEGLMIIFLGLCISFHFLIVQFFINPDILFPIPPYIPTVNIPFSWADLDVFVSLTALGIIIFCIFFYFISNKIRDWFTNKIPIQSAFWEFLTLIDREERMQFLTEFGDIIRETLIGGIMDFIDRTRDEIETTIRAGLEFFRQFFSFE